MRKLAVILVIALLAAGGYLLWQNHSLQEEAARLKAQLIELTAAQETEITIYLVDETPTDFLLVPVVRRVKGTATPEKALELLIQGPAQDERYRPAVSPETKVQSLTIVNGVATVSFNQALRKGYVGGSQNEANLVNSIVHTLTEFPQIQAVQILFDGEKIETIGGHLVIDVPLRRN